MIVTAITFIGNPQNLGAASLRVSLLSEGVPILTVEGPEAPHPRANPPIGAVHEGVDYLLWEGTKEADTVRILAFDIDGTDEGIVLTDDRGKTHFYALPVADEQWQTVQKSLDPFRWYIPALILAALSGGLILVTRKKAKES